VVLILGLLMLRRGRSAKGPACAFYARQGKKHPKLRQAREYIACLNERQARKLFPGGIPAAPIGCGVFACAWPVSKDRVVKITADRADVEGMIRGQGLPGVAKVYATYELPAAAITPGSARRRGPLYAIEVERLEPLPRAEQVALNKPLNRARAVLVSHARRYEQAHQPRGQYALSAADRERLARTCPAAQPKCTQFVSEIVDLFVALFRRGVVWQDVHVGNIAKGGPMGWKAIDLGVSPALLPVTKIESVW
jgi:hypothetical protein